MPTPHHPSARSVAGKGEAALAYLYLLPALLILGVFAVAPLVNAALISLRDWRLTPGPWVGLSNYHRALRLEPDFWQSLQVTGWYVLGLVPGVLFLGVVLASFLEGQRRAAGLYRLLFFLPYVVSPVAAAAVWKWMLNPDFGVASAVVPANWDPRWLAEDRTVGEVAAQWVGWPWLAQLPSPSLALACVIAFSAWQSLGFAVVILLAGLTAIPSEIQDAARLDGAQGWQLLTRIKLPLLSPTLFFLLVVLVIRAFQAFSQISVLSVDGIGGPRGATRNLTVYIFEAIREQAPRLGPGYGCAVAMILFGMIAGITLIQFRVLGKRVHYV